MSATTNLLARAMRHHVWDRGRSWAFVGGLIAAGIAKDIHSVGGSFAWHCILSALVTLPLWALAAVREKTHLERLAEYKEAVDARE